MTSTGFQCLLKALAKRRCRLPATQFCRSNHRSFAILSVAEFSKRRCRLPATQSCRSNHRSFAVLSVAEFSHQTNHAASLTQLRSSDDCPSNFVSISSSKCRVLHSAKVRRPRQEICTQIGFRTLSTNKAHDLGGRIDDPLVGKVDQEEGSAQFWEKQIHALLGVLSTKGLITTDELRRAIESLSDEQYKTLRYYEKWSLAMSQISIERNLITDEDLAGELGLPDEETETDTSGRKGGQNSARFSVGERVRVREETLKTPWRKPHLRTPGYIFGKVGVVQQLCGFFPNPEQLAFRQPTGEQPLYRVKFKQKDVWEDYSGSFNDTVSVEIYQKWLTPAEDDTESDTFRGESGRMSSGGGRSIKSLADVDLDTAEDKELENLQPLQKEEVREKSTQGLLDRTQEETEYREPEKVDDDGVSDEGHVGASTQSKPIFSSAAYSSSELKSLAGVDLEGGSEEDFQNLHPKSQSQIRQKSPQGLLDRSQVESDLKEPNKLQKDVAESLHEHHQHGGHHHIDRASVEQAAVDLEGPSSPYELLGRALINILVEKGIVTKEDLRQATEKVDMLGKQLEGPRLVVRAWTDPSFKSRLLENGNAAAAELGISASNANAPTVLTVVENTDKRHNLVVCTLCSCYPTSILGLSPAWYKSRSYRSRAVREPRSVLREFGTEIPDNVEIVVHDSTADCRYMVLPRRPHGTDNWSEEELMRLITRDSLLGVSVPVAKES